MSVLFLVIGNVCEELLFDLGVAQFVVHGDGQPLGLGVHITHLHSAFVVEKYVVGLARGIDANVKLLILYELNTRVNEHVTLCLDRM